MKHPRLVQTNINKKFLQIIVKKYPSSILCWDLTHGRQNMSLVPEPLDQGSRPKI